MVPDTTVRARGGSGHHTGALPRTKPDTTRAPHPRGPSLRRGPGRAHGTAHARGIQQRTRPSLRTGAWQGTRPVPAHGASQAHGPSLPTGPRRHTAPPCPRGLADTRPLPAYGASQGMQPLPARAGGGVRAGCPVLRAIRPSARRCRLPAHTGPATARAAPRAGAPGPCRRPVPDERRSRARASRRRAVADSPTHSGLHHRTDDLPHTSTLPPGNRTSPRAAPTPRPTGTSTTARATPHEQRARPRAEHPRRRRRLPHPQEPPHPQGRSRTGICSRAPGDSAGRAVSWGGVRSSGWGRRWRTSRRCVRGGG